MDLCLTDAEVSSACGFFSCSLSEACCSVKVDGARSSLSAAVGGPVWLNEQSMKPLLAAFFDTKNVPSH